MSEAPVPGQPVFAFAEKCDRGRVREENQDNVLHARVALGDLLIVADGIGGYKGGGVASRMVVESFFAHLEALPGDYPADRAIHEAAALANATIFGAAQAHDSPHSQMGSTVVMALLQRDLDGVHAWVGHIGDSRAYLARGGLLTRLTNDHSAVQDLLNRNLITPEEALHHPDASVLTRSLGHQPEVAIDIDRHPLFEGDTLLLCSDGLWGYVAEADIQTVACDPGFRVETAAQSLLDLALAAGGHDNIGIEMARLDPAPAPPPAKRRRPGLLEVLALCLLALATLGTLAYFGYLRHWLHAIGHPH